MHIRIIAIGKLKDPWMKEGTGDLLSRLRPYTRLTITEFSEEKCSSEGEKRRAIEREGALLLTASKNPALLIALDPAGRKMPSEAFADLIREREIAGTGDLVFLIGGPDGLSDEVRERSDLLLSLSEMTFPHTFARLLLLEQIYRAFRIIRGEPYHR